MRIELPQIFLRKGRAFDVEAGQPIISRGAGGKEIFIVVSGRVLLHSSSVRGREFVIDVLKSGDPFGVAAWLDVGYRVDAISLRCGGMSPAGATTDIRRHWEPNGSGSKWTHCDLMATRSTQSCGSRGRHQTS